MEQKEIIGGKRTTEEEREQEEGGAKKQKSHVTQLSSDPVSNYRWFWKEFKDYAQRNHDNSPICFKELIGGLVLRDSFSVALCQARNTKLASATNFRACLGGLLQLHFRQVMSLTGMWFLLKSGSIRCVSHGCINRLQAISGIFMQYIQDLKPLAPACCTLMTDDDHYSESMEIAEEFIQTGTRLVLVGNIGSANDRKCEITEYRDANNLKVHIIKPLGTPDYTPPSITISPEDVGYCANDCVNMPPGSDPKPQPVTLDVSPIARGYFKLVQGEAWHRIGTSS